MAVTATFNLATQALGNSFNCNTTATADAGSLVSVALGPAQAGVLTTRTSVSVGTLTMANPSHGITTGARLDIYFSGGQRYGCLVGTVSGVSVPFTVGGGTDLPALNDAITAMVPNSETVSITGANVQFLVTGSNCSGASSQIVYTQSDNTFIAQYAISSSLQSSPPWFSGSGFTNPVTGVTIGKIYMSHGDSTAGVSWLVRSAVGYN